MILHLSLWCVVTAPAPAAAIRHTPLPDPGEMGTLESYLEKGPRYWATHALPTVPAGISILESNGSLKSDLFVRYLVWRWEKDPAAFDVRHPHVGAVLTAAAVAHEISASDVAKALTVPSSKSVRAHEVVHRRSADHTAHFHIHPEAQLLTGPTSVPEPSSSIVVASLLGAFAWWRRRPRAAAV